MSRHAISVFDKVLKWKPEKMHLKNTIKGKVSPNNNVDWVSRKQVLQTQK